MDRIKFANDIIVDKEINKGKQHLRYKLEQWNREGNFGTINNISEHFTLVQIMDSIGNVNHAVSVVSKWIFDSNFRKSPAIDY